VRKRVGRRRRAPVACLRAPADRRELDAHALALTAVEGVGNSEERARACRPVPLVSERHLRTPARSPLFCLSVSARDGMAKQAP
jgi:hypothetical protein